MRVCDVKLKIRYGAYLLDTKELNQTIDLPSLFRPRELQVKFSPRAIDSYSKWAKRIYTALCFNPFTTNA